MITRYIKSKITHTTTICKASTDEKTYAWSREPSREPRVNKGQPHGGLPLAPRQSRASRKPIMHMKSSCYPSRISVFGGPKDLEGSFPELSSKLESCRPMSCVPTKNILAKNSLPIIEKLRFANWCSSSHFRQKCL